MTVKLKHSIFLHIPKTGGVTITNLLLKYVSNAKPIGDKVYDSHLIPEGLEDWNYFCFIRKPAQFAHSLWYHRARKKGNTRGRMWNWENNRLEQTCKSQNYNQWMTNIYNNSQIILDNYNRYILSKPKMLVGRLEYLNNDLHNILRENKESYDEKLFSIGTKTKMNAGKYGKPVEKVWIERLEDSESELMEKYYK